MAHAVQFVDAEISNETDKEITQLELSGMGIIPQNGKRKFNEGTTSNVLVQMQGGPFSLAAQDSARLKGEAHITSIITDEGDGPILESIQIRGKTPGGVLKWIEFRKNQ